MKELKTSNGIIFNWYLTSQEGANYELFPERHHTKKDLDTAKEYLRNNFDPISIKIIIK